MDYENLKPGLYLQRGSSIKSLDYSSPLAALFNAGQNQSPRALVARVSWVFVAIERRLERLLEIPRDWESERGPLIDVDIETLLQKTDMALQLMGVAYWLKQRAGRRVVGVRWLDPDRIEPDYKSLDEWGEVTQFTIRDSNGGERKIPATDVTYFCRPGLGELRPGTAAGEATRLAAQVLLNIQEAVDTFFDNNALPTVLIKVPMGATAEKVGLLQKMFDRLFNSKRGTRKRKVMAVDSDIGIERLSLAPNELAFGELLPAEIDAILAAHMVPRSVAGVADAANYATAARDEARFTQTIGARLSYIARVVGADDELVRVGLGFIVTVNGHPSVARDMSAISEAFLKLTSGMLPEAAAYLLGIRREDFPDDMEVFAAPQPFAAPMPSPTPAPMRAISPVSTADIHADEMKADGYRKLHKYLKAGKDPALFESDVLTPDEIQEAAKTAAHFFISKPSRTTG